jgi:hypothetical protein
MRSRHWWGAAVAAGVLAGAMLASPASAAPVASTQAGVAASGAVAGKSKPVKQTKAPVVRKGRYVARDNRPRDNRHSNGHDNGHDNGHNNGNNHDGNHGNSNHDGGHGHSGDDHPYPCNGTPSLNISVPDHVHKGREITVSATARINGEGVRNAKVGFYGSIDNGKTWKLYATAKTDGKGNVSYSYTPSHEALLRVVIKGGDGLGAAQSTSVALNLNKH